MNSAPGGEEQRGFNLVARVRALQPEFTWTCAGRNWPQGQVAARDCAGGNAGNNDEGLDRLKACPSSADVVLLPMQGGVGLDNDVLVRGLLELVDEHGFAGLQSFS